MENDLPQKPPALLILRSPGQTVAPVSQGNSSKSNPAGTIGLG
jgi:hypothetical protein